MVERSLSWDRQRSLRFCIWIAGSISDRKLAILAIAPYILVKVLIWLHSTTSHHLNLLDPLRIDSDRSTNPGIFIRDVTQELGKRITHLQKNLSFFDLVY